MDSSGLLLQVANPGGIGGRSEVSVLNVQKTNDTANYSGIALCVSTVSWGVVEGGAVQPEMAICQGFVH